MLEPKEALNSSLITDQLKRVGWQDGLEVVSEFRPNSGIGGFYLKDVLQTQLETLNPSLFFNLKAHEKNELLSIIYAGLEINNPVKMLDNLKEGLEIVFKKRRLKVRFFDFNNPENNLFFFLPEVVFRGPLGQIRPDFTLFVNGLPLVIIEVKKKHRPNSYLEAVKQIERYERECPGLFNLVQLGIAWGDKTRYLGTWPNKANLTRQNRPGFVWREGENHQSDIAKLLQTTRLLDYLKNYVFFSGNEGEKGLFKLTARYMQYFAAEKIVKRAQAYLEGESDKNKGLIWHWQGSGKTYAMFFAAQKFFNDHFETEPVVFFLLDRRALVKQLFDELSQIHFKHKSRFHKVVNVKDLEGIIKNIREAEINHNIVHRGIYVSTLQKFTADEAEEYDKEGMVKILKEYGAIKKKNILVLFDEAHRSLYGDQGALVQAVMPQALKFGFTGTPILHKERNTFELFAYPKENEFYLDRYFISQSLKDGFTLKLTYKTVREEGFDLALNLEETKALVEEMLRSQTEVLDEDALTSANDQIQTHLDKTRIILTRKELIQAKANYIAKRIQKDTEDFNFKAMVIVSGKKACVRYKQALDKALTSKFGPEAQYWSEIVMSWGQNETEEVEIYRQELYKRYKQHNTTKINENTVKQFKKSDSRIKILIVTDMLLTGFDAPILKVAYLDKMLYGHRLLQAVTRTNRPYLPRLKEFGLIVDFVGIFHYIEETMAFYNQFEDKAVREDFKRHLVDNLDKFLEELVDLIGQVETGLSHLVLYGQDFSINLDKLVEAIKQQDRFYLEQVLEKLAGLALYLDDEDGSYGEVQTLIDLWNKLRRVVRLYVALGAHPDKVKYLQKVKVIQFILDQVRQMQKKQPPVILGQDFWDSLDKYLDKKTKVDGVREVSSVYLGVSEIKKMQDAKVPEKIKLAHFYYHLKNQLKDSQDPLYLAIYERIRRLHTEWIQDKISLEEFMAGVKQGQREAEVYKHTVESKSLPDRIVFGLNQAVINQFLDSKAQLKFTNLRQVVEQIQDSPSSFVSTYEKKQLAEALLMDIFVEAGGRLKGGLDVSLEKKVQDAVDLFIVPMIEQAKTKT